jgi:trimethylamine--corrinoid protein Co-methyltransferase
LNRDSPETWTKKGGQSYSEVVTRKALEILDTHRPEPLPEDVCQRIEDITGRAERELADIQFVA